MSEASRGSSRSLILGLAAAVVLALGLGVLVYTRQPAPSPANTPEAPPSPVATEPRPSAADGAAPNTPAAAGAAGQPPAPGADSAAAGSSQAPAGTPAGTAKSPDKPPAAATRGTSGAPPPLTAQAMMRRTFSQSKTASENVRGASSKVSGFDAKKAKEVQVKRAPEVDGRIEFSTTPLRVRPGDKYQVRIALVNDGKRSIELKELHVTTKVNGRETATEVKPLVKEVESHQNEVVHQLNGTWDKATTSWALEVRIVSARSDVYRNQLSWK